MLIPGFFPKTRKLENENHKEKQRELAKVIYFCEYFIFNKYRLVMLLLLMMKEFYN